jgi:hypothetical protein
VLAGLAGCAGWLGWRVGWVGWLAGLAGLAGWLGWLGWLVGRYGRYGFLISIYVFLNPNGYGHMYACLSAQRSKVTSAQRSEDSMDGLLGTARDC